MQRLQGIDQNAGDVAPRAQHVQRIGRHLLQGVGLARGERIADARLHIAPPTVIGAAEPHQMRAPRVITRQAHRLHDGLGAGHVERDLVEAGDLRQALDVVGQHGMEGAEHGAEILHAAGAVLHARLVEIVAEHVDAVRARQIVEGIAVEIGERDAGRRLQERSGAQVLAHDPAELERHPVGGRELQVGEAILDFRSQRTRLGEALLIELRQACEAGAPRGGYLVRRVVGAEELRFVELVERNQRRQPPRHARMPGQRPVLGLRQLQARSELGQRGAEDHRAEAIQGIRCIERVHGLPISAIGCDAA